MNGSFKYLDSTPSILLGLLRFGYFGSTTPLARYFRIVLRDSLVLRAISRIETPSRRCQRLITLNIATLITPSPTRLPSRTVSMRGSNFHANHPFKWIRVPCKSTVPRSHLEHSSDCSDYSVLH
jgi:hypothetical protein